MIKTDTNVATAEVNEYFVWLVRQVEPREYINNPLLFKIAYETPFTSRIAEDDNRIEDGKNLRLEFFRKNGKEALDGPCTMLEFLIGVARRLYDLAYEIEDSTSVEFWFWGVLMRNLQVDKNIDDGHFIRKAFNRINTRTYASNGVGGLFPLKYPTIDQRDVEIWYQMQQWFLENYV